ncbi:unnamed protein product [Spodoptera exigua]|nr:unnamed protein product [Spodoptera exigua]
MLQHRKMPRFSCYNPIDSSNIIGSIPYTLTSD